MTAISTTNFKEKLDQKRTLLNIETFNYSNTHTIGCDIMKLSDNQERAIEKINRIMLNFGKDRWFIQEEVIGAGYKTLMALVNKGILVTKYVDGMDYYQKKR